MVITDIKNEIRIPKLFQIIIGIILSIIVQIILLPIYFGPNGITSVMSVIKIFAFPIMSISLAYWIKNFRPLLITIFITFIIFFLL